MKKLFIVVIVLLTLFGCVPKGEPVLVTPTNLRQEGNQVLFDEVMHATHYIVEINGVAYTTEQTFFNIVETGDIRVRVKAQAEGYQDSLFSNEIQFTLTISLEDVKINYSIYSTFDLVVYEFSEDVIIERISRTTGDVSDQNYSYDSQKLSMKSPFLVLLTKGDHEFVVHVKDKGSFTLTITINDVGFPYMISHRNRVFESQDIVVLFALYEEEFYDSEILSLTGNGITSSDYVINGNMLTIHASFIENYFQNNPDKTTLSLQYSLKHAIANVPGFIFIQRPSA